MSETAEAKRLFIGLTLSSAQIREIEPVVKKLKATADKKEIQIRWAPKENWHVTLVFLGPTSREKTEELKGLIRNFTSSQSPLEIHLRNLGGFPDVMGARVLWVGVASTKKILDLQKRLEDELLPWGYKGEERAYSPHVTIARLRNQKSITDMISPWVRKDFGKMAVSEITLYESRPAGYFSTYVPLEKFQFTKEINPENTDVLLVTEEDKN